MTLRRFVVEYEHLVYERLAMEIPEILQLLVKRPDVLLDERRGPPGERGPLPDDLLVQLLSVGNGYNGEGLAEKLEGRDGEVRGQRRVGDELIEDGAGGEREGREHVCNRQCLLLQAAPVRFEGSRTPVRPPIGRNVPEVDHMLLL